MDTSSSPYIAHYNSFHFLFHYPYITPIFTLQSLYNPYMIPRIHVVSMFFSIPSFPASQRQEGTSQRSSMLVVNLTFAGRLQLLALFHPGRKNCGNMARGISRIPIRVSCAIQELLRSVRHDSWRLPVQGCC